MVLRCVWILELLSADPLWELECCKIQWFRGESKLWNHSLQILSGSWNAVKHNGLEGGNDIGITLCRSSLVAGMLIKQKWKWSDAILDSLTADPLWELECCKNRGEHVPKHFWTHSLQILFGSWNAVKTEVRMYRPTFGLTHCRLSLGAGML